MDVPCPACGKVSDLPLTVSCPRCSCDLSQVGQVLWGAVRHLKTAAGCLRSNDPSGAHAHARKSWELRHSSLAAKLAFLACVRLGEQSLAMEWCGRARRADEADR